MIYIAFGYILIFLLIGLLLSYGSVKENNNIKRIEYKLNSIGILFNHSLEITNNKTGDIKYIRVYRIFYDNFSKSYKADVYIFKNHEIGEWSDDVEYLYTIPNNNTIKDFGEWQLNKIV